MNQLRMHKPYPKQLLFFRSRKRYTAFGGTKPQWGFGRLSWRSHIAGKVRAKIRNAFYAGRNAERGERGLEPACYA